LKQKSDYGENNWNIEENNLIFAFAETRFIREKTRVFAIFPEFFFFGNIIMFKPSKKIEFFFSKT
jgi:hypothetical protein